VAQLFNNALHAHQLGRGIVDDQDACHEWASNG
jgi:hypothetical protein